MNKAIIIMGIAAVAFTSCSPKMAESTTTTTTTTTTQSTAVSSDQANTVQSLSNSVSNKSNSGEVIMQGAAAPLPVE